MYMEVTNYIGKCDSLCDETELEQTNDCIVITHFNL